MKKFLILLIFYLNCANSIIFYSGCESNCFCEFVEKNITIKCYVPLNRLFYLPEVFDLIVPTTSITVKNSFLINYPLNVCQYSNNLIEIILSGNQISQTLNGTSFNCLNKLEFLDLSNNSISIIEVNSFDSLQNLKALDLSYNRIESIPTNLFYLKLQNLKYMNLRNNLIKEIDIWMLSLRNLIHLDLRFNQIRNFINRKGWAPYNVTFNELSRYEIIDLRYNQLTSFDDDVLRLFNVCTANDFFDFLNIFSKFLFENNNINCDCKKSFNTLTFYQSYIIKYSISIRQYLFFHKCSSPGINFDKNIFTFADPNECSNLSLAFSTRNCGISTTTIPSLTNNPQNLIITTPKTVLNETNIDFFNDAQIAGYVIGIFGIIFLFLILLYCICPIEILSVCFNCIPVFYSICPCKSGVKSEKEFDLFISYNEINEPWVRNKLIPFIKSKYLIESFILHYNPENKKQEIFGDYVKNVMDKSNCILFILSDAFLMKEWNNRDFRLHLRNLITKQKTRFIAVQMHDVCDEEVDEYFIEKLQIPRFVSLENDEFLFWNKLAYFLFTNNPDDLEFKRDNKVYTEKSKKSVSRKKTKVQKIKKSEISSENLPNTEKNRENIKIPSQKLPKTQNRKFLLDEIYSPINVTRTASGSDSTIGLRFHHENYDIKTEKKGESIPKSSSNAKESEFLRIFTDREENDLSPKKSSSGIILEADYRSKLRDETYFRFKNS